VTDLSMLYRANDNSNLESMTSDAKTTEKYIKSAKQLKSSRKALWEKLYKDWTAK
jgi:hypothetical protein